MAPPANSTRVNGLFASIEPRAFRKTRNLWLAYASEAMAPAMRAAAAIASKGARTEPGEWRRGLILSHTHIGDVLYRTCSLAALRDALPYCEWSYAASPASAEALRNNPHLSEVLPIVEGEDSWQLATGGLAALAQRKFDVALCTNTLRHYPDLILSAKLGIPNRVAFSNKGFSGLITHPVHHVFPDSYPSCFRAMVSSITKEPGTWPLAPAMHPGPSDEVKADELWKSFGLGDPSRVVACSVTTRQARGNWPESVILDVLTRARMQNEFDVVLCGAREDAMHLREVAEGLPFPARILAGEANILTFAAFLRRCSALLTLDSGPRHIGNAMGIPVIFARNLAHSRIEAGRYCASETDLAPDVEYLSDDQVNRVTRGMSVDAMARVLLDRLSAQDGRA